MRKDVREFIRRLEATGLTVESTPGHYRVLRDGKPLRKSNGMPCCRSPPTRSGGAEPRSSTSASSASTSSTPEAGSRSRRNNRPGAEPAAAGPSTPWSGAGRAAFCSRTGRSSSANPLRHPGKADIMPMSSCSSLWQWISFERRLPHIRGRHSHAPAVAEPLGHANAPRESARVMRASELGPAGRNAWRHRRRRSSLEQPR